MNATKKCLKEWNATIEALGQGKQTILIRNYNSNVSEFLLYPTVSYVLKNDWLDSFQNKHQSFVKDNDLPKKENERVLIKYYAKLEKVIEKRSSKLPSEKYYIWNKTHVNNFMKGQTAFIWVLRVYILKEPYWAEPTPGAIVYANLKDNVSLIGMEPVLHEKEYSKIVDKL